MLWKTRDLVSAKSGQFRISEIGRVAGSLALRTCGSPNAAVARGN